MSEPLIVCTMLTADRPAMAARAVRSFLAQDYENKILLIYDTGGPSFVENYPQYSVKLACDPRGDTRRPRVAYMIDQGAPLPLCELMNHVSHIAAKILGADLIAKWDDDDWSHARRLSEQRALMFKTGARVVGYNDMPFLDERHYSDTLALYLEEYPPPVMPIDRVYIYSNPQRSYALGTSLLYEASAWREFPFPDTTHRNPRGGGSDTQFVHHWAAEGQLVGVSQRAELVADQPRMIATLHAGNQVKRGDLWPEASPRQSQVVREIMSNA